MRFFKRKPVEAPAVAPGPEIVEIPAVTADELERMVYETYREKLSLEDRLKAAAATIEFLKEQVDKLNAAETFARQSEAERKRLGEKAEELEDKCDKLSEQLRQERARVAARDAKIESMYTEADAHLADKLFVFLGDMRLDAEASTGNWSRARVVAFIDAAMQNARLGSSEGAAAAAAREKGER